jgi:hypothetical protein
MTQHGARSERRVSPLAKNLKRRVLRQLKLRVSDLDPVSLGYVEAYVRAAVKVRLYDAWLEEHGLVNGEGATPSFMPTYVALLNSSRLSLARLEDRLGLHVEDPLPLLELEGRRLRLAAEARFAEERSAAK